MNIIEIIAAIAGLVCAIQIVRQKISNFFAGIIQYSLYTIIFANQQLYGNMVLQLLCLILCCYGVYEWHFGGRDGEEKDIINIGVKGILLYLGGLIIFTISIGWFLGQYMDDKYPYIDAFLLCANLIAQWLLSRKVIQTWVYWLTVNITSIIWFIFLNMWPTVGMYIGFLIIDITGTILWVRSYYAKRSV